MSKVTTPDKCVDFQAHKWKKDSCVNCSRPQTAHVKTPNPAMRKPKPRTSVTASSTTSQAPASNKISTKLGSAHDMKLAFLASDTSPTKQAKTADTSPTKPVKRVDTSPTKPVKRVDTSPTKPVKPVTTRQASARPNIPTTSTVSKLSKQTSNDEEKKKVIETAVSKSSVVELAGRSVSIDSATTSSVKPDLARSHSAKAEVTTRDSTKRNRKYRMSRPAGPPPQAPPKSPESAHSTDSIHLDQIPSELLEDIQKQLAQGDGGSHYYHKYDVSASLRRKQKGQPAIVDIEERLATASPLERAALIAKIKSSIGEAAVSDVLPNDITADQIAMPYNIVDVSAQLPKDDRPPQLPSSPAPGKDASLNRAALQRKKMDVKSVEPRTIVLKEKPSDLPTSPNKVPILIQTNGHHQIQHTYEPINDPNGNKDFPFADETSPRQSFVRASPIRSTAPVRGPLATSWKATDNNKVPSLEHLDLNCSQSPSPPSPTKVSPKLVLDKEEISEPLAGPQKVAKTKDKPKKDRSNSSSGGGGFFKKLFGFGRRESDNGAEEKVEMELSSDSIEEEVSSSVNSNFASAAPSTDDLSVKEEISPPISQSPLHVTPRTISPVTSIEEKMSPVRAIPETDTMEDESDPDRVNHFVSFSDEMEEIFKGEGLNLNITEQKTEDATLVGATSLTDEIMDMLSNFGDKDPKKAVKSSALSPVAKQKSSSNPIPSPRSVSQPSPAQRVTVVSKPGLPSTKPTSRPRPSATKPPSPSVKPPSPPIAKTKPTSDHLGELRIEIDKAGEAAALMVQISPQVSFEASASPVRQSASQSSLDRAGTKVQHMEVGDTSTIGRRNRPRSTAVSRKMLNAPPPPPTRSDSSGPVSPISPKPGGSGATSPTKISSQKRPISPKVKPQSAPRHLEISAPISVITTLDASQTLPRPIHRDSQDNELQKSVDDLTEYRKKKRGDSVAKHSRNKTVTEGIAYDLDSFNSLSEDDRMSELVDNGNHKFVNRALPPPPPSTTSSKASEEGNYEFVSSEEGPAIAVLERENYEDIDGHYSAIPADMVASDDYLQPISHTESLGKDGKPKTKPKSKWTPKAAKRLSEWAEKKFPSPLSESYVMVYANTEVLLDKIRPALTIAEGFNKMSTMNQQTLHHLAEKIFHKHCPENPNFSDELRFDDFGIGESEAVLTQGCVCMYRARQAKIQPFHGFLMLSAKSLHRGFLEQQSCHLVSPAVLISDRISAEFFPEPNDSSDPDHYQLYGQVQTNMAFLHYNTVTSLQSYVSDLIQRTAMRSAAEEYERQVCYCLAQIFTGILDSYSNGPTSVYTIKTLGLKDIAVVSVSKSEEKYLVINAASQNHCKEVDYETLGMDIIRILGYFLHLDISKPITERSIAVKSRYSKALRTFLRIVSKFQFESLIEGKNLLEYLLWGPCNEDHNLLMAANDPAQAFCVWLEVARCKAVTNASVGQLAETVYTANRLQFLCCVTGNSLQETAALLK